MIDRNKKENPVSKFSTKLYQKEGEKTLKKRIKKIKFNFFKFVILFTMLVSSILLIHDFIFWGIIPMFSGITYQLTYFGLLIDLTCIGLLEVSIQLIKEW